MKRAPSTEEPCAANVACTVLKASEGGDPFAEPNRALRHWVIARRISQGTRTAQGSRALALLASVIETCRKRNILPWPYLAHVLAERRKGHPAPPLPAAAVS
jgi:hypothetical protein